MHKIKPAKTMNVHDYKMKKYLQKMIQNVGDHRQLNISMHHSIIMNMLVNNILKQSQKSKPSVTKLQQCTKVDLNDM